MNFTKGDWKVTPSGNSYVIGNGENWIARLFHSKAGFGVNSLAPKDNEVLANAHLIAAAPIGDELATAVLEANFDDMDDCLEIKDLARKFKAKAEGKENDGN